MHIGGSVGWRWKGSWAGRLKLARDYVAGVGDKETTSRLVAAERESRRNECERILAARREARNAARTLLKKASSFFSYFRELILPAESHLVVLEGDEAMIGDGHAVGVAGEISSSVGLSGTSRSRPPYALLNANHHALAVDVGDF
jgi:hypothetical protein